MVNARGNEGDPLIILSDQHSSWRFRRCWNTSEHMWTSLPRGRLRSSDAHHPATEWNAAC